MTQTVHPYLLYKDLHSASQFLATAFGFREVEVPASPHGHTNHSHIEMQLDEGFRVRMTGADHELRHDDEPPMQLQIAVKDIDGHYERAVAAGARIVTALTDRQYGDREYVVDDPEGQRWSFIERAAV